MEIGKWKKEGGKKDEEMVSKRRTRERVHLRKSTGLVGQCSENVLVRWCENAGVTRCWHVATKVYTCTRARAGPTPKRSQKGEREG